MLFVLATAIASPTKVLDAQNIPWADNGDGTFSFVTKSPHPVGELKEEGGVVWEHQGPNRIPTDAKPYGGEVEAHYADGDTDLLGSVQIDGYGGRWVAIDADLELLAESQAMMVETAEKPDETHWTPLSYTDGTCASGSEWAQWFGESRNAIGTYSNAHDLHRSVVRIENLFGGNCTGVMVGPRDVLTNAHCVTLEGLPSAVIPVRSICSQGNSQTNPGADCMDSSAGGVFNFTVTVNGNWTGGSDNFSNDYALIEWDAPNLSAGPTSNILTNFDRQTITGVTSGVPISTWPENVIEATRAGTYGHPSQVGGSSCNWTTTGTSAETTFNPAMGGRDLRFQWRTDHWHSASRIKTHYDASSGQSGSPIYQCVGSPTSCSGSTEAIIGLVAGKRGTAPYVGGPRADRFRSWVIANMF